MAPEALNGKSGCPAATRGLVSCDSFLVAHTDETNVFGRKEVSFETQAHSRLEARVRGSNGLGLGHVVGS